MGPEHGYRRSRTLGRGCASIAAAALAVWLAGAPSATAAVQAVPARTFVTDGRVNAVAATAHRIYLAGKFDRVGPPRGPWGTVSTSTAAVDTAMPKVSGGHALVHATVSDGAGGFYIGGDFTHVGGVPRLNLAHVLADRRVDPSWHPSVNAFVNVLRLAGSTVYIGGSFKGPNSVNGTATRNYAAAVDATTGSVKSWNPDLDGPVYSLAVWNSTVFLGGIFRNAHASTVPVARVNAAAVDATTAAVTAWDPRPRRSDSVTSGVFALAVNAHGQSATVFLGGSFDTIDVNQILVARHNAAAVDAESGSPTSWNPNVDGTVDGIALVPKLSPTIYLVGRFHAVNGSTPTAATRNHAAAFDAGGTVTPWNPDLNGDASALALMGSTVFIGGSFSGPGSVNGGSNPVTRNYAAAVDAGTGAAKGWNPSANHSVTAMSISNGAISLGGAFSSLGGQVRHNVAALNMSDGTLADWNPDVDDEVFALALSNSKAYIGGSFQFVNGQTRRNHAAALSTTTAKATGWDPNVDGHVFALALAGDTAYLGGDFAGPGSVNQGSTSQSPNRQFAAAVNATTGKLRSWNPRPNAEVMSFAVAGSAVYLVGDFTTAKGNVPQAASTRNYGAAVDGVTGALKQWNPNFGGPTTSIALAGSTAYVGGLFGTAGGHERRYAAAVDATTGGLRNWKPNLGAQVTALAVAQPLVYLATRGLGTKEPARIAAVNAATGLPTGWDESPSNTARALALGPNGELVAGGLFNTFPTVARAGIALFRPK